MMRFIKSCIFGCFAAVAYFFFIGWRRKRKARAFVKPLTPYDAIRTARD